MSCTSARISRVRASPNHGAWSRRCSRFNRASSSSSLRLKSTGTSTSEYGRRLPWEQASARCALDNATMINAITIETVSPHLERRMRGMIMQRHTHAIMRSPVTRRKMQGPPACCRRSIAIFTPFCFAEDHPSEYSKLRYGGHDTSSPPLAGQVFLPGVISKTISNAQFGQQELWLGRIALKLVAEVRHIDPQVLCLVGAGGSPDFGEQELVRQHFACVLDQQCQQVVLDWRQVDFAIIDFDRASG